MNLKREAAKSLKTFMEAQVPSLSGKVFTVYPDEEQNAQFPALYILPQTFEFQPFQEDEEFEINTSSMIVNLGAFEGTFQLRIAAKNLGEREDLEDLVMNAFFQTEGAPGVVVTSVANLKVGGVSTTYSAKCAFTLENEDWSEELVFSKKRYSFLDIGAVFDACAVRTPIYNMNTLVSALTGDMDESDTPTSLDQVQIADDGTVSAYP